MKKIISLFLFIFLSTSVLAVVEGVWVEDYDFWTKITNSFETGSLSGNLCQEFDWQGFGYSSCQPYYQGVCSGDDRYYCQQGYTFFLTYGCQNDNDCSQWLLQNARCSNGGCYTVEEPGTVYYGDIYCYMNDMTEHPSVMECPFGCENGRCEDQTCNPGWQWCENNYVIECAGDGMSWYEEEFCDEYECTERSDGRTAYCRSDIYFCINNNFDCVSSSATGDLCFESELECIQNIVVWCADSQGNCVRRQGFCHNDEQEFRGTDLDNVYTACVGYASNCEADIDCPVGFYCSDVDNRCIAENSSVGEPGLFESILNGLRGANATIFWISLVIVLAIVGFFLRVPIAQLLNTIGVKWVLIIVVVVYIIWKFETIINSIPFL